MALPPDLAAAKTASTPLDRLAELSRHKFVNVRVEVTYNPSTPVAVLRRMSDDPSPKVREGVALNKAIDDETVLLLASDPVHEVRRGAAINARSRDRVIAILSTSPDAVVRQYIAWHNSAAPLERVVQNRLAADENAEVKGHIAETTQYRDLFDALMADANPKVRGRCAGNPRATRDDLERLIADRSADVRGMAAGLGVVYPDDEQLVRLARDRSANTQWVVTMRVGAPREALEIIAREGDELNRTQAQASLAGRSHSPQVVASALSERARATSLDPFI